MIPAQLPADPLRASALPRQVRTELDARLYVNVSPASSAFGLNLFYAQLANEHHGKPAALSLQR